MRKWFLLLALCAGEVGAQVSLNFQEVGLADLCRVVYGEVLKKSVVIDSSVVAATDRVSMALYAVQPDVAGEQLRALLEAHDFAVVESGNVVRVGRRRDGDEQVIVYRPAHRSAEYLVKMARPFFKGAFSEEVQTALPATLMQGQVAANVPATMEAAPVKTDVVAFRGDRAEAQRLQTLLRELDTPTPELMVHATVYEVTTQDGEQSAFGLAVSLLGGRLGLSLGTASAGAYSASFKSASISAVFNALATDAHFKVVSSPSLRVRSGSSAKLTVGTQTPVLGATQVAANGTTTQSVEYKPSGVILNLRPEVRENVTELTIEQQISDFQTTTTGVNNSPTLVTRELSTVVGVRSGEVLVLGGLNEDKANDSRSGLPWLPEFLHARGRSGSRTEILLVVQVERL